jgi:hypothetical protein
MADVPNNLDCTYYEKRNHIRLSKSEATPRVIRDAAVQRATSLGKTIADGDRVPNEDEPEPEIEGLLMMNSEALQINSVNVRL